MYVPTNYILGMQGNDFKIMNLVGINHCKRKQRNMVDIKHLPALANLSDG